MLVCWESSSTHAPPESVELGTLSRHVKSSVFNYMTHNNAAAAASSSSSSSSDLLTASTSPHLRPSRIQTPPHRDRRASGGSSAMAGGLEGFSFEQRHGKDRVRVARVWRAGGGRHSMVEWDVSISLFSDIVGAYARGNNSGIVATDTMKNTVPNVFYPPAFRPFELAMVVDLNRLSALVRSVM